MALGLDARPCVHRNVDIALRRLTNAYACVTLPNAAGVLQMRWLARYCRLASAGVNVAQRECFCIGPRDVPDTTPDRRTQQVPSDSATPPIAVHRHSSFQCSGSVPWPHRLRRLPSRDSVLPGVAALGNDCNRLRAGVVSSCILWALLYLVCGSSLLHGPSLKENYIVKRWLFLRIGALPGLLVQGQHRLKLLMA